MPGSRVGGGASACLGVADEVVLLLEGVVAVRSGTGDDAVIVAGGQTEPGQLRSPGAPLFVEPRVASPSFSRRPGLGDRDDAPGQPACSRPIIAFVSTWVTRNRLGGLAWRNVAAKRSWGLSPSP